MRLHLGVIDIPYNTGGKTTGDVAEILEDKYHIVELFYEEFGSKRLAESLERAAVGAIENIHMGGPSDLSLTAEAMQELEKEFHDFLSLQKLDFVVPGVPTAASLAGVSHRKKRPYAKANKQRPSFIDTGTYLTSFRAWVEP